METIKENKEVRIVNPGERLADVILDSIITHQRYMRRCRGIGEDLDEMQDNARRLIQVRSLSKVISIQRELITNSRGIVYHQVYKEWSKKYSDQERKEHPFEKEDNDYNTLMHYSKFMQYCHKCLVIADKTKTLRDDFLVSNRNHNGEEINNLTDNFHEMLEDLEASYQEIYLIMLRNGVISQTIEEEKRRLKSNEIF